MKYTVESEIFTRNFFCQFSHLLLLVKIFIHNLFLSCVNDYIKDMVTYTILAKINLVKY